MPEHAEYFAEAVTTSALPDNPYPGPRPFTPEETGIFFGREEQTAYLVNKLTETRFLAIVGSSGCGKSSLARAGVIAALTHDPGEVDWRVAEMQPGNTPLRNLAEALLSETALGKEAEAGVEDVTAFLRRDSHSLIEALREAALPETTHLLLVVDQFDDLLWPGNAARQQEVQAFIALLLTSVQQRDIPIYVVMILRAELLGVCVALQGLSEVMQESLFLVPPLSQEQLVHVIVEPAQVVGGSVESQVVDRLLEDLTSEAEPLPVLQHCLRRMWERAQGRASRPVPEEHPATAEPPIAARITITLADYDAVGRVNHAFARHADEAFHALKPRQQAIAEVIFQQFAHRAASARYAFHEPVQVFEIASIARAVPMEVIQTMDVFRSPEYGVLTPPLSVALDLDSFVGIHYESLFRSWQRWRESRESQPPKRRGRRREGVFLLGIFAVVILAAVALSQWISTRHELEQAVTRLAHLRAELTQKVNVIRPFRMKYVEIKDATGAIVHAVRDAYYIESGETLTIEVNLDEGGSTRAEITYTVDKGTVQPAPDALSATYRAPENSGEDTVNITARDPANRIVLDQVVVKFKVY